MLIQTEIPEQLWRQTESLVKNGWAENTQSVIIDALRRYIESHQEALSEQFIREDIDWGLHGGD